MPAYYFSAASTIHAAPALVWDILADYQKGHPQVVAQSALADYHVEAGGYGEGTVIRFAFKVAGTTRQMHQRILTPEPGRVLVERDIAGAGQTTFTLTSQDAGASTLVDILTEVPSHAGVAGVIERAMARLIAPTMQKLYREELANLDRLAQTWQVGVTPVGEPVK